ncbi:hypothetical protein ACHAWF_008059, partial [Thalassiosira exigua]
GAVRLLNRGTLWRRPGSKRRTSLLSLLTSGERRTHGRASLLSVFSLINQAKDASDEEDRHIPFPESTSTLLHMEPVGSLPFWISSAVAALSTFSMALVLLNSLGRGFRLEVPAGVGTDVRCAQYCGILVGLLMEEEIPQGLNLLRFVSKELFQESYPNHSYTRFVLASVFRIVLGYLFLANLYIIIVQADNVIAVFFDILTLEFA